MSELSISNCYFYILHCNVYAVDKYLLKIGQKVSIGYKKNCPTITLFLPIYTFISIHWNTNKRMTKKLQKQLFVCVKFVYFLAIFHREIRIKFSDNIF